MKSMKFIKVMGTFFTILLFITFFSKTIYNFNLPTVTVMLPAGGKLVDLVEESTTVSYPDINNIYAEKDAEIKDIYVTAGQKVKKGQRLMEFEPNHEDIRQLTVDIQKKERDIELLAVKIKNEQSMIEDAKSDLDSIKNGEYAFNKAPGYELDIHSAEEALNDKKALYESGAVSRSEVDAASQKLEAERAKYKQYMGSEQDRITQLLNGEQENICDLQSQTGSARLDLAALKEKLERAENGGIIAETDGVVISIDVDKGSPVNSNDILLKIARPTNEWRAELVVDEEKLDLFDMQSTVDIIIKGITTKLTGKISAITLCKNENEEKYKVTVNFTYSNRVLTGKKANIQIKTERGPYTCIIPNCALRKDSNGYYILVLREENNALGKNYIAHRVSVDLLDSDSSLSAIHGAILTEPVITASTTPVDTGNRVKYIEAGDEK